MWPEAPPEPEHEPQKRPMLKCILKHPDNNRCFIAILDDGTFFECEVSYTGPSSCSRAVMLDNAVMPVLFEKLRLP